MDISDKIDEMIRHEAMMTGLTYTTLVNTALQSYFERFDYIDTLDEIINVLVKEAKRKIQSL